MAASDNKTIFVTQPHLPPLEDFIPYLKEIWDSRVLTNGGPFHQRFEAALCEYLGVQNIALFCNGTQALVTALQTLRITGEVITTPYSFVATAHSLLWNGIKPVFVDIDPETLNLDPARIEAAITPQTTAILAVHCYGRPCEVEAIQEIADVYNLKVIYDAAHAFGVRRRGTSILNFGDISILSFHATKIFNTFEGGAIVCADTKIKQRVNYLKNFGFADEVTVVAPGINGKMSEFNAALGLLQLEHVEYAFQRRKAIAQKYRAALHSTKGLTLPSDSEDLNNSYFPILVGKEYRMSRDDLYQHLRSKGIYARRYFYPLISEFPMYRGLPSASRGNVPHAAAISESVLCLPIYPALSDPEQDSIIEIVG